MQTLSIEKVLSNATVLLRSKIGKEERRYGKSSFEYRLFVPRDFKERNMWKLETAVHNVDPYSK